MTEEMIKQIKKLLFDYTEVYDDKPIIQGLLLLIKDNYISKDKIRDKINELTLKNKIPIKDQYVMYDVIKRNFQIEILEELLNEEGGAK